MIVYEVKYKKKTAQVRLYNRWDVDDEEVVDPLEITDQCQRDKYVAYTDGFDVFAKIKGRTVMAFATETGVVKRKDYCRFSRIQYPYTNYSGARSYDEHPLSRPYRRAEYLACGNFIKRNIKIKMTPRIRKMTKDKLIGLLDDKNIDADWIVTRLIREADHMRGRGADRLEAIKILARIKGQELEKPTGTQTVMHQPLFQQFNQANTIQDQRRKGYLESRKEIAENIDGLGLPTLDDVSIEEIAEDITSANGNRLHFSKIELSKPNTITPDKVGRIAEDDFE